jgi:release factor glutamine methyltransferase
MSDAQLADTIAERLRDAGCVFAEDEAAVLLADPVDEATLEQRVQRRVDGEPLEHVVGWAQFLGARIEVGPGVFVPRPRTEALANEAIALTRDGTLVVDLCCGSGALGFAVASARPDVELHAADVDGAAVSYARRNLTRVGAGERVYEGDLFEALPAALQGRVDVLVANVPYVPTDDIELMTAEAREHEPHVALDGGDDGLEVLRRVATGAATWLAPGGHVLCETSTRQLPAALAAFSGAGLAARSTYDDELDANVVIGTRPPA